MAIDSDASYHVTSDIEYLASFNSGDYGHVKMENEGLSKRLRLLAWVQCVWRFSHRLVLIGHKYVLCMRLYLISTGVLDDDG